MDFLTSMPYLTKKNMIIFVLAAVWSEIVTKEATIMGMLAIFYSMMNLLTLFAIEEQNGTNFLCGTLPIKRSDVVKGRYLFSLLFCFGATVGSVAFSSLFALVFFSSFTLMAFFKVLIYHGLFMFSSFLAMAVQMPILFHVGYQKGKTIAWIAAIIPAMMTVVFSKLKNTAMVERIPIGQKTLFLVGGITVIMLASYSLAKKKYLAKDF